MESSGAAQLCRCEPLAGTIAGASEVDRYALPIGTPDVVAERSAAYSTVVLPVSVSGHDGDRTIETS